MRVLIADDDAVCRTLVQSAVVADGHSTVLADDGDTAWALYERDGADMVITDWMMPGLDGLALCTRIREHSVRAQVRVYILFLSMIKDRDLVRRALDAGADDYLPKPLDPVDLRIRLGTAVRVTDLYHRLVDHQEQLTRSNAELERFADELVHDIYAPLSASIMAAQLLVDEGGEPHTMEAIATVRRGLERMQGILMSMQRYARASRPGALLALVAVDLDALARRVVQDQAELAGQQAAQVTLGALPTVLGDAEGLRQVLTNLLRNALLYGGMAPRVHLDAVATDQEWQIRVHDSGPGLSDSVGEQVFEPFVRGHLAQDVAGSGLGLAICKRIVGRHGGRIWAAYTPGQGLTVSFTLPIPQEGP